MNASRRRHAPRPLQLFICRRSIAALVAAVWACDGPAADRPPAGGNGDGAGIVGIGRRDDLDGDATRVVARDRSVEDQRCRSATLVATSPAPVAVSAASGAESRLASTAGHVEFPAPLALAVPRLLPILRAPPRLDRGSKAWLRFRRASKLVERCAYAPAPGRAAFTLTLCDLRGTRRDAPVDADAVELELEGAAATDAEPITAEAFLRQQGVCPVDAIDPCPEHVWFEDRDADGFGNPKVIVIACEPPPGFVADPRDCNDDPQARGVIFFPGAKEPCNYSDFNCDTKVRTCSGPPPVGAVPAQVDDFVLSSFEPGHPFVASPGGSHNLNDTADVYPGIGATQSAFIQTDGQEGVKTLRARNQGPYDFSGAQPKLWVKLDRGAAARDLSLYLGNQNFTNFVRFTFRSSQGQKWITEGDWVAFTMSWNASTLTQIQLQPGMTIDALRRAITDVQLRVVDDGSAAVTLHVNRISAVREPRDRYPNGVVSFTFDDSWASEYVHAKPRLDLYGYPATAYTIVGFLDTPDNLTTAQLMDLQRSSGWEVAFHAFDPVMHVGAYTNFPAAVVEEDMLAGRQWLWENGFDSDGLNGLANFAYPKGEFRGSGPTDVLALARQHFASARAINERHHETVWPSDPHKLRVLYITAPETVEKIIDEIERGIEAGEWIILTLHHLVDVPLQNDQWEIEKFNQVVDHLGHRDPAVPVRTVGDVLRDIGR